MSRFRFPTKLIQSNYGAPPNTYPMGTEGFFLDGEPLVHIPAPHGKIAIARSSTSLHCVALNEPVSASEVIRNTDVKV
jgi:hypothetical protein